MLAARPGWIHGSLVAGREPGGAQGLSGMGRQERMTTLSDRPDDFIAGPLLYLRGVAQDAVRLAVLVVVPAGVDPGDAETPCGTAAARRLATRCGMDVLRYDIRLPSHEGAAYSIGGRTYPVATRYDGDLRLAYVSCNGMEDGDLDRPSEQRNAVWLELAREHAAQPFHLLLGGGDQIYADSVTQVHPLTRDWPEDHPDLGPDEAEDVTRALADGFFRRYVDVFGQPGMRDVAAQVPMLSMWDDHDICDGWGSLPRDALDSDMGRILFHVARDAMLLFQFAAAPDEVPEICLDRSGRNLGWAVDLPGLRLIAPDLRSERRPERIMAPNGWAVTERALAESPAGKVLLVSSTPILGPRLSLVERMMKITPWMEEYEDDLRDQWQSYAHRAEWQRMLRAILAVHERPDTSVTIVSGEIHLAAQGEMRANAAPVRQIIASGIAHPPPAAAQARTLGALAFLGEAPLKGHPIKMRPLPGRKGIYTAQRNYLTLSRRGGAWTACWHLEESGPTPDLAI